MSNKDRDAEWWERQDRKSTISLCISLAAVIISLGVILAQLAAIS